MQCRLIVSLHFSYRRGQTGRATHLLTPLGYPAAGDGLRASASRRPQSCIPRWRAAGRIKHGRQRESARTRLAEAVRCMQARMSLLMRCDAMRCDAVWVPSAVASGLDGKRKRSAALPGVAVECSVARRRPWQRLMDGLVWDGNGLVWSGNGLAVDCSGC